MLNAAIAVDREKASGLAASALKDRAAKNSDKRNLYLLNEGTELEAWFCFVVFLMLLFSRVNTAP